MFVAHRERHHSLVEARFAEKRLGMLIDQVENLFAARFNFVLQRAHKKSLKTYSDGGF